MGIGLEGCLVLVFLKDPASGRAKSRIAATHGRKVADEIYAELLGRTTALVEGVPHCLYVDGIADPVALRTLFPNAKAIMPQCGGDLGKRMACAARDFPGEQPLIIIGTDCPALTPSHLQAAFAALDEADIVLGPALDGGYYLIALRSECADIFSLKAWSHEKVLADTLELANKRHWKTALLETLSDIDVYEDYLRM